MERIRMVTSFFFFFKKTFMNLNCQMKENARERGKVGGHMHTHTPERGEELFFLEENICFCDSKLK